MCLPDTLSRVFRLPPHTFIAKPSTIFRITEYSKKVRMRPQSTDAKRIVFRSQIAPGRAPIATNLTGRATSETVSLLPHLGLRSVIQP
jgi:hypothetical protein